MKKYELANMLQMNQNEYRHIIHVGNIGGDHESYFLCCNDDQDIWNFLRTSFGLNLNDPESYRVKNVDDSDNWFTKEEVVVVPNKEGPKTIGFIMHKLDGYLFTFIKGDFHEQMFE